MMARLRSAPWQLSLPGRFEPEENVIEWTAGRWIIDLLTENQNFSSPTLFTLSAMFRLGFECDDMAANYTECSFCHPLPLSPGWESTLDIATQRWRVWYADWIEYGYVNENTDNCQKLTTFLIYDIICQKHVGCSPGFQRDRMKSEMLK